MESSLGTYLSLRNGMSKDGRTWSTEEDALLGTNTDRIIAERLGRSSVSVSNRRKKLGIKRPDKRISA